MKAPTDSISLPSFGIGDSPGGDIPPPLRSAKALRPKGEFAKDTAPSTVATTIGTAQAGPAPKPHSNGAAMDYNDGRNTTKSDGSGRADCERRIDPFGPE